MLLTLALACNEYDLNREEPPVEGERPADTGVIVEEEPPADDVPDIELTPSSLDFGYVLKDCTSDPEPVTITNLGTADLVVDDVWMEGSGDSYFAVSGGALPFTLGPMESTEVYVTFSPVATTSLTVDLVAASNDPDEPEASAAIVGAGASAGTLEENFQQNTFHAVDVLWILDNSCSMSDALTQVENNFDAFIDEFVALELDYHIGVVTTDMSDPDQSGRLQGSPTFIDSTTPDPQAKFLEMVDQGANGSADEKGFDAAYAALTDPLKSGDNAGFLRGDDTALAAIVVSDENDYSSMSASAFTSWMTSLKSDPALVSFSAICGDRGAGCTDWTNWSSGGMVSAIGGGKYIDAADATGGIFQSICTDNFDEALHFLGLEAAGMQTAWTLSQAPENISELYVWVAGYTVVEDSDNGWTFDHGDNTLTFHGDAIPGPGELIEVEYPVSGECN